MTEHSGSNPGKFSLREDLALRESVNEDTVSFAAYSFKSTEGIERSYATNSRCRHREFYN